MSTEKMEELLHRHRQEKKELQAKITQKKKSASKKTRKGVNDECERLEHDLQARHAGEVAAVGGGPDHEIETHDEAKSATERSDELPQTTDAVLASMKSLDIDNDQDAAAGAPKKPKRAKARLARRAAEQARLVEEAAAEAKELPDLRAQERERMAAILASRELVEHVVRADGHCLYAATADQIKQKGREIKVDFITTFNEDYRTVRYVAADQIQNNADDYVPFLEEDLDSYLDKIRDTGEWGGQIELMALSKAYNVKICVVHGDGNVIEIGDGDDDSKIWLAYYRHGFGLGEHYNSLRTKKG